MTVSSIGFNTNSLQAIRAKNAFQTVIKNNEKTRENINIPKDEGVKVSISSKILNTEMSSINNTISERENRFIGEIKEFADKYNITNVKEDDIQDALKYGTSLFADYIA